MKPARTLLVAAALPLLATAALAQSPAPAQAGAPAATVATARTASDTTPAAKPATTDSSAATPAPVSTAPAITIQHLRPSDQRGVNVFETPKADGVPYRGFKLDWGGSFSQTFQGLSHENTAAPKVVGGVNQNQLMSIGHGFNTATANLYLNGQLAPGIRVALETYLSAKHHNEAWVKGGYLLIDESPIKVAALENLMKYLTLKIGHFEINYGDAHFRRADNGQGMYNPFVGNLILDAFTTEIGAEALVRKGALLGMVAVTGGEIKGNLTTPEQRKPALYAKVGVDQSLGEELRFRLTGSLYRDQSSPSNTLYGGDRGGSRYFLVLENTQATTTTNAFSGTLNPAFRREVTALQVNPFVKVLGLELFGVAERATGWSTGEAAKRSVTQYDADAVYRVLGDRVYVGARYNTVSGAALQGLADAVTVKKAVGSLGWFLTPTVLLKGEWIDQRYTGFPSTDIRNGGRFSGFLMEGAVSF